MQCKVKVKWSRYRPDVAHRVGWGIALLFHDSGTRREWVVSSTPRPHFTPGKDPVPIVQEAGWAPGPVWTGEKSRLHRDLIPDLPTRVSVAILSELSGPHIYIYIYIYIYISFHLTLHYSTFYWQRILMDVVRILWIPSLLNDINPYFLMETRCVFCELGIKILKFLYITFMFQRCNFLKDLYWQ